MVFAEYQNFVANCDIANEVMNDLSPETARSRVGEW